MESVLSSENKLIAPYYTQVFLKINLNFTYHVTLSFIHKIEPLHSKQVMEPSVLNNNVIK